MLDRLREMPDESVHMVCTSPPYWGLRSYGVEGQLGLEATPDEFVANMVEVFAEVKRVLRSDGCVFLNIGDSYAGAGYSNHDNTGGATRAQGGKQKHTIISAPPSSVQREVACGICGKAPASYQERGSFSRSLCDACHAAHAHKVHKDGSPVPMPAPSLFLSSHDHTATERDHLPTSHLAAQAAHNSNAIQGQVPVLVLPSDEPHGAQVSTMLVSSLQPLDGHSEASNQGEGCPLCAGSSVGSIQVCADTLPCPCEQHLALPSIPHPDTSISGTSSTGGASLGRTLDTVCDCFSYHNYTTTYRQPQLKSKDLCLIPARLALALQADGWWIRSEITWCKRSPMPESVRDRPTSATEKIYLLTKSDRYFYDADAVREGLAPESWGRMERKQSLIDREGVGTLGKQIVGGVEPTHGYAGLALARNGKTGYNEAGRNQWNYWLLSPDPYPEAHFATFPREIPRRAILAGTSERGVCGACGAPHRRVVERERITYPNGIGNGTVNQQVQAVGKVGTTSCFATGEGTTSITTGWTATCPCDAPTVPSTVLDCFSGAGTTGLVAVQLGRRYIGLELNQEYIDMSLKRIHREGAPLFAWADGQVTA